MLKELALVVRLFTQVLLINRFTEMDVFFNYSPHINCISLFGYKHGWKQNTPGDILFSSLSGSTIVYTGIGDDHTIKLLIKELRTLHKEYLSNKSNEGGGGGVNK